MIDRIEGGVGLVTCDYVSASGSGTIQAQSWILEDGKWKYYMAPSTNLWIVAPLAPRAPA